MGEEGDQVDIRGKASFAFRELHRKASDGVAQVEGLASGKEADMDPAERLPTRPDGGKGCSDSRIVILVYPESLPFCMSPVHEIQGPQGAYASGCSQKAG